ncbi:Transcription factor 25 [Homalodisca vitripennis]|nr:Transcription factor 25 [Homalodisca vitripennis]
MTDVGRIRKNESGILTPTLGLGLTFSNPHLPPAIREGYLLVTARSYHRNSQSKRRGGSRTRGHLKTTWLVSPKENWPPIGKPGLSMSLVKTENGVSTFTYEHSINYQQVQVKFLDAVESLNPDNIVF